MKEKIVKAVSVLASSLFAAATVHAATLREISIPETKNWVDAALLVAMIAVFLVFQYTFWRDVVKRPDEATKPYLGMPMLVILGLFVALVVGGDAIDLAKVFPGFSAVIMEYILKSSIWMAIVPYIFTGIIAVVYHSIRKITFSFTGQPGRE